jgi:hypothetical protein
MLSSGIAIGRTSYVEPDGTGDAPTIQAGADSAAHGDTLLLADGTYRGDGNRDVYVRTSIWIMSESEDPEACIIDCEGSAAEPHRGFEFHDYYRAHLIGVTITNGWHGSGGAVYTEYSHTTFRNCRFVGNHAANGGAAYVTTIEELAYFIDCIFMDNSAASYGGALCFDYPRTCIECRYCTFVRNSAGVSGGVGYFTPWPYEFYSGAWFYNCTMVYNLAPNYPTVVDCGLGEWKWCIVAYNEADPGNAVGGWCSGTCCCLYGNVARVGECTETNFAECPSFCNSALDDYHLCDGSPCAPGNHPNGYDCGLIGALDVGCTCGPTATETRTWGGIKARYR